RSGVKLSKWNCYRVKSIAHRLLHGNLKDHSKLATYLQELKRADQEFMFKLETIKNGRGKHVFQRLYVSFQAMREGFLKGCRKIVCIDGCFLKTFLGVGQWLNQKNNESWEWFLECVKYDLPGFGGEDYTIISDQHKSIIRAVRSLFPNVEHRNCARHIYPTWHKKHKSDGLKKKFGIRSTRVMASKSFTFCRFGFRSHTKCNLVVNNLAETFNRWI
ncbi:Protein FAR-RED IMPAIRED RESPONSE 1, partial [Bienertia sinuspersici]